MKKFIFLRWLFGLSLGLFLFGSSGYLTAQENVAEKYSGRHTLNANAQTQPMPAEKQNAIGGTTFTVPSSGTRATTDIKLELTTDFYYYECSYNLWSWDDMAYYWPTDQTFTSSYETITHILALEEGSSYDVDCFDSWGDGGIGGLVSNDATGWPIIGWSGYDYYLYGAFNFIAGPGNGPPANDLCATAELIVCGDVVSGETTYATTTDAPTSCTGTLSTAPGVWYTFVGNGLPANISLCGSSFDTKLAVFSGTCGTLVCEDYNDDFCSSQSEVNITTVNGDDYYIYVTGYGSGNGDYTMSLTCVQPGLEFINKDIDLGFRPIGAL